MKYRVMIALGLTGLAFAPWGAWRGSKTELRDTRANATRAAVNRLPATEKNQSVPHFRLEPGHHYTYNFTRSLLIVGFGKKLPEIKYGGELRLDILASDGVSTDGLATLALKSPVTQHPLSLRVGIEDGGRGIRLSSEMLVSPDDRQLADILKDVLAQWLFPLGSDTVGPYTARFVTSGNPGSVSKTKLAYRGHGKTTPEILASSHALQWNPAEGYPRSVEGSESTRYGTGNLTLSSTGRYRIDLKETGLSRISGDALARMTVNDSLALSSPNGGQEQGAQPMPTWSAIAGNIMNAGSLRAQEQLGVFGDLVKRLRAHPENLPDLLSLLSPDVVRSGMGSQIFRIGIGALATVASPEAQAALIDLYRDPGCQTEGKGAILSALTTTQAPLNSQTRDFLLSASQNEGNTDLADGAGFALGAALHDAPNDESAQKAIAAIENAWTRSAGSTQRQITVLDTIGNSGRPEFLPILRDVLATNADPFVKGKAAYSLRFMHTGEAIALLVAALEDRDPRVRLSSASAIQLAPWNQAFASPLKRCISAATDTAAADLGRTCLAALQAGESSGN